MAEPLPHLTAEEQQELCILCHQPVAIRNPTGHCDHLYYPDNLNKMTLFRHLSAARGALERIQAMGVAGYDTHRIKVMGIPRYAGSRSTTALEVAIAALAGGS